MSVEGSTGTQDRAVASSEAIERPLISIIIPVYNEERNVEPTYDKLKQVTLLLTGYRFEFVFTDNHSTDSTFERLSRIAARDSSVRVARFARNFGFQKSVLTGYRLARGAAAIQIDADMQDPPEMFGPFLEEWRAGHDVVVGVRRKRKESAVLFQGRRLYYRMMRWLDGEHLIADAGDFRLVDRSVLERLRRINDPHIYLRGLISSLARNQIGIPVDRAERLYDQSKFRIRGLARLALDGVLSHSSLPLRVSFYVGLAVALGTVALSAFYIIMRAVNAESVPQGFTSTQIIILFGIGLNSIFLGILGVYVGRIYDQVRRRPPTVISDLVNFDDDVDSIENRIQW